MLQELRDRWLQQGLACCHTATNTTLPEPVTDGIVVFEIHAVVNHRNTIVYDVFIITPHSITANTTLLIYTHLLINVAWKCWYLLCVKRNHWWYFYHLLGINDRGFHMNRLERYHSLLSIFVVAPMHNLRYHKAYSDCNKFANTLWGCSFLKWIAWSSSQFV